MVRTILRLATNFALQMLLDSALLNVFQNLYIMHMGVAANAKCHV